MQIKANKWGASLGIRLNRPILDAFKIDENTPLNIEADAEKIVITKAKELRTHKTLEEYLTEAGWDGVALEPEKIDWGTAVGEEVQW